MDYGALKLWRGTVSGDPKPFSLEEAERVWTQILEDARNPKPMTIQRIVSVPEFKRLCKYFDQTKDK